MKIGYNNSTKVEILGEQNISVNATIDQSNIDKLLSMFSEGLYKDGPGSVVREWTSNALDAHAEANTNLPVTVSLYHENNQYIFEVEDKGTGISPDKVKDVISKYGKSTKENDDKQIGFYGLGLKAGHAVSDNFFFITCWEGTKYTYIMYKSGISGVKIDLLHEEKTEERNGTIFKIVVQQQLYGEFKNAIEKQLAYIPNIYYSGSEIEHNNNKTIYYSKSKNWAYCSHINTQNLHLCLDGIYYPIDFEKLDIPEINIPVAIIVSSKEVIPIPTREDIIYSPRVKKYLKDKIKEVLTEISTQYNSQIKNTDSFFKAVRNRGSNKLVLDTDVKLTLNKEIIEKITNIKLENPSISYLTFPSSLESLFDTYGYLKRGYILNKYKVIAHLHNGKLSKKTFSLELSDLEMCDVVLILSSYVPRGKYLEFLKDKYPYKTIFFVKYLHDTPLYSKSFYTNKEYGYHEILKLNYYPKREWRDRIIDFQKIEKEILDKFIKIEDIPITKEWLNANKTKKQRASKIEEGEIRFKLADRSYNNEKIVLSPYLEKDIEYFKYKMVIYGNDEKLAKKVRALLPRYGNVISIYTSKRDCKKLENQSLINVMTHEEFLKGKNKWYARAAACILYRSRAKKIISFSYTNRSRIYSLNRETYNYLEEVDRLKTNFFKVDEELEKEVLDTIEEVGYYDSTYYTLVLKALEVEKTFYFLGYFKTYHEDNEEQFLVKICKKLKIRLNKELYNIKENN